MPDDRLIISLLQKRDERALQHIRELYGPLCFRIAEQIVGNSRDAEECLNDMLINVWNTVPPHSPVSLRAYLVTLVRRAAIDRYKSVHRIKRGGAEYSASLDELAEILPSDEQVEKQVEQRDLSKAITNWLRTLSAEDRSLFLNRYYLSESVSAVAEQSGMSEGALKMKLMRLRKKLKAYLEKEGLM